jgi:multidrug efflux system membrane fusion protein
MLHEGNIVRAGGPSDSTLVVINQIQPVYVSFTVPQQQLPVIRRYMAEGPLEVRATPAGDTQPQRGTVTFVDNVVDAATGTIRLKGTFLNSDRRLWPGQFANVELLLSTEPDAIVVPAQAVQSGQGNSTFVFVVRDDSTVETRRITVKRTQGAETVVGDGLKPGEKVVTDGMPRLVAGAKVEIRAPGQEGGRPGSGRRPGGAAPGDAPPGGAPPGGGGTRGGPAPDASGKAPAKAQP